jgi:3',5'-cyclic AMP phosphodiesterase CpdA
MASCYDAEPTDAPLKFFVIGDWGRLGSPNQMVVANQMNTWARNNQPKFIISTGDNFYYYGVSSTDDVHWMDSFEKVYNGDQLIKVPWYVVLGNHDHLGNPKAEIQYHTKNDRWNLPANYYTRLESLPNGGKVRFVFTDTSPFEHGLYASIGEPIIALDSLRQKKWLDSVTAINDAEWKIVVGHHHIYTGGTRKNESNSVRASLEPIFIKNKVDVYFCGHEHDLQHLKSTKGPTNYFLSGAGSDLRETGTITETQFAASVQGFMSVEVRRKSLQVNVVDYKGNVLYSAMLEHP